MGPSTASLDDFRAILGPAGVLAGTEAGDRYLRDWAGDYRGRALAVLRPQSVAEVQAAMRLCRDRQLPVMPLGGNTGLVAGAVVRRDDTATPVILSLERLNRIREVNPVDFTLRADAGCILQTLKEAAEAVDCLLPLSLGAQGSCQVGGNAATNAGGVNVLRYGMARDLILGLEVVLPDGTLWSGMSGLRKDNRGYDLKQLFIGSEGTLGIITGVEMKLVPRPARIETAYLGLASFADAITLLARARHGCADLMTAFEVIGVECIPYARSAHPDLALPVTAPVHVLIEVSCSGALDLRLMVESFLAEAMEAGLVGEAVLAASEAQARAFWRIREGLVEGQMRSGYHMRTDLSVRPSRIPALVDAARGYLAANHPDWTAQAYGHAGDGNLHFNAMPPATLDEAAARATGLAIETALFAIVTEAGGSISAEHGIGRTRRDRFWTGLAPVDKRMFVAIKTGLDPDGLMNPGCVIPREEMTA